MEEETRGHKNNTLKIILIVLVVLVLGGFLFFLFGLNSSDRENGTQEQTTQPQAENATHEHMEINELEIQPHIEFK